MKKLKIALVLTMAALAVTIPTVRAGVVLLAGSGYNIPANTQTNFTGLAQVGTFVLSPQYIYISTANGVTVTNAMKVNGRITFDGTNFFQLPQVYSNNTTNPLTGQLWIVTNTYLPVYGTLTVTNGTGVTITNFTAQLQF